MKGSNRQLTRVALGVCLLTAILWTPASTSSDNLDPEVEPPIASQKLAEDEACEPYLITLPEQDHITVEVSNRTISFRILLVGCKDQVTRLTDYDLDRLDSHLTKRFQHAPPCRAAKASTKRSYRRALAKELNALIGRRGLISEAHLTDCFSFD